MDRQFEADSGQSTIASKDKEKEKSDKAKELYLQVVGCLAFEKLARAKKEPFVLVWAEFGLAPLNRKQDYYFVGLSKSF